MTRYLTDVIAIAKHAGHEILKVYQREGEVDFKLKPDDSPITEADLISHDIINSGLAQLTPDLPVLSEEGVDVPFNERKEWQQYWLVDPLDGTNEFINRTGQFTVNIALIDKHDSVLGVSYAPERDVCYFACRGQGAFREDSDGKLTKLNPKAIGNEPIRIVVSKMLGASKLHPFLSQFKPHKLIYFGGSLKLCLVAEGAADIYPRLGCNCEWDTAAGQCIVEEAGGMMVDLMFNPLRYNTKESLYVPHFFVAGDSSYNWQPYMKFLQQEF